MWASNPRPGVMPWTAGRSSTAESPRDPPPPSLKHGSRNTKSQLVRAQAAFDRTTQMLGPLLRPQVAGSTRAGLLENCHMRWGKKIAKENLL